MSGLVTTLKPLDREQKASYKIIIEVSDHGQPPQAATRVLRINVLDIDDHRPRFVRDIVRRSPIFFFFPEFSRKSIQSEQFSIVGITAHGHVSIGRATGWNDCWLFECR